MPSKPSKLILRASIIPIMLDVKAKLQTDLGMIDPQVRIIARDPGADRSGLPNTLGAQHLLLRPLAPVPQQEWVQGAGRVATIIDRTLSVIVRTRLQTDAADYDEQWLTATTGHFVLEDQVCDSLQLYEPKDGQGNHLVIQPMRLIPSSPPQKEHLDEGWGETTLNFSLVYAMALNQKVQ